MASLGLYLETSQASMSASSPAQMSRVEKLLPSHEKSPFLTEAHVAEAQVVNAVGGFALRIAFNRQGSWLLEQYSTANRGKHFVIFSQWVPGPGEKLNQGRWLAAPLISSRITDGILTFTPDATREEAEQLALGLHNVAKRLGTASKW